MARPLRPSVPGGVYHVMSRGNEKREIFLDDCDRDRFLRILHSVTERANVLCHGYCLMGNHYHLVVETPDGNISAAVRQLNGAYAQSFNRRHERVGHLFQGRFASKLVERETYLLVVSRYVVRNPVRAGFVTHPSAWEWSSYRAHAGLVEAPVFLCVDWLLDHFGTTDRNHAQAAYRVFVDDDSDDSRLFRDDRPVLGTDAFVAAVGEILGRSGPLVEVPRKQRLVGRPTLSDVLGGCDDRKSRNRRIHEAHVRHGYTMTEIAQYLDLSRATISRAVRDVAMQDLTPSKDPGV